MAEPTSDTTIVFHLHDEIRVAFRSLSDAQRGRIADRAESYLRQIIREEVAYLSASSPSEPKNG